MSSYLESKISIKINYIYKKDYKDILDGFKDGTIDMAYLGPLPYLSLKKKYEFVEPILTFKQDDGLTKYRCVLVKFQEDEFKKDSQIKVALTQPLSTCGYFMSSILLRENFNIDLSEQTYKYTMSHVNALNSVLKGECLIAGVRERTAKEFESLGLEIIAKSKLMPGFSLIVNTKTLTKEQIKSIKEALLELQDRDIKKLKGILVNGVVEASERDYDGLSIDIEIPQKVDTK
ncbi:MAG: PhnD/SsuA/transferrin family substrate-binding protein [Sulfurimonas sp.]|uniref:PhnD/SsuA/transferrin family substrate-binding protein n=1 Tax=Sulfurimonas sp. TaxID=2022749 RepID=UPI0025CC908F|nr:PhnD/SsuA/transferrin family substrate-binding protein [Sulfurimonas sp.]MCK9491905.1 PhnD/SsuA/transferrin family substrate-binding protein [Sulfurimonas sp.]